jgi:hypothetical protein
MIFNADNTRHREVGYMLDVIDEHLPLACPVMVSTNRPDMGLLIEWIPSGEGILIFEDGTWQYADGARPKPCTCAPALGNQSGEQTETSEEVL